MDDAIYLAASGMHAVERMMENSTFNTVNAHTPGYQRRKVVIQDFGSLLKDQAGQRSDLIGAREYISFEQGSFRPSELPFAAALDGEGFFGITDPAGRTLFTRNGDFTVNAQGELVTRAGYRVQDSNGQPVVVDPLGESVGIDKDGTVVQGGEDVAKLKLVDFSEEDRQGMTAMSETLFAAPEGAVPREAEGLAVRHGYLETPQFDAARGLVQMLVARKNYESMSRAMKALDETRERLIQAGR
jgi:flagellar basal-body rod protein FlgF